MANVAQTDQKIFESEVQRIARQLWPEAQYAGATMAQDRERDGVFEMEDCVHLVEATVSRTKVKAQEDVSKLVALARQYQKDQPYKAVKCWFVTRDEPTADQRTVSDKHRPLLNALSYAQFQSKLIDVAAYLNARDSYPFGSVRDPATGATSASIDYVNLDLIQTDDNTLWSLSTIITAIQGGTRFVMLGDYGAGKSMTLRELYRNFKKAYFQNKAVHFPVYINLRDHYGQTDPAEVLERHGRAIGFAHPSHLVRAWRAGYVVLLIDGFDEIAALGIQGVWKRLQDVRYRAMQAVRQFIREHPKNIGLILSGRAHFFDSDRERRNALGLTSDFTELTLNEFSDDQIQRYLEKCGLAGHVPSWMPSRPLLVGYLAASGLLRAVLQNQGASEASLTENDPAQGWDILLDKICQREAEIEAGIDGQTVRRILERLATVARSTQSGVGPLTSDQLVQAFKEICGYQPDEKGWVLLQRLPGLGIERADEGTRSFIDTSLWDACMAGDVVAYVDDPYSFTTQYMDGWEWGLGTLGVSLGASKLRSKAVSSGKMNAVLQHARDGRVPSFLLLDLAHIALDLGCSIDNPLQLDGISIPLLEFYRDMADCSKLSFTNCYFTRIEFDPEADAQLLPRFHSCYMNDLEGLSSERDLPKGIFDENCVFDHFSEVTDTSAAITKMDLPLTSKVLLIVLKKLYFQSGSGRKENALQRGLDHHGRRIVPPVLKLLQTEGLALPYKRGGVSMTIWVPDRSKMARVGKILSAPHTCGDPLLAKVSSLD